MDGFSVTCNERVRWGDLDAFGHVNNTVFFRYFESARIKYFEVAKLLDDVSAVSGAAPILAQTSCQFLRPIRYPNELVVGARVTEVRTTSFTMEYVIVDAAKPSDPPFARGEGVLVMINYATGAKVPLTDAQKARFSEIDQTLDK